VEHDATEFKFRKLVVYHPQFFQLAFIATFGNAPFCPRHLLWRPRHARAHSPASGESARSYPARAGIAGISTESGC
jgi:hypothetical protein